MLSPAIDLLNAVANDWSEWILVTFMNTAGLLVLLGMIWLLVRRRVSPQIGYWLFLLVPLKLLVPVQIALPIAVANWGGYANDAPADHTRETSSQIAVPERSAFSSPPRSAEPFVLAHDAAVPSSSPDFEPRTVPPSEMAAAQPAVAPTPPTPPMSYPTPSAIAMLLWLAGALVLTGRWFVRHGRFHQQLKDAAAIDPDHYPVNLRELRQRAGISSRVRFVESDRLAAPAVAGIFRPTMILPRGLARSLTPVQIEWAVLHELAHIGRGDLAVILLQRLAAILHFFNPAIWIANRLANRLREYACDDLASVWTGRTPIETGEAFVQVLRYASSQQRKPAVGLGILGLDTRSACGQRVRRMLGRRENALARPSRWSILALILIAALALPHLRAGDEATKAQESTEDINKPEKTAEPTATPKESESLPINNAAKDTFELIVVGPDEKPVPGVEVEFRRPSKPSAEDVLIGMFVKPLKYGSLIKANADGRIVLNRSHLKKNIQFIVEQPGFGPYYYGDFNSSFPDQTTPDKVTVHLDEAWSIGSRIVDSEGRPISGVKVNPGIRHKRPPGTHDQIGVGTNLTTDEQGRWHYGSVPVSMDDVHVEINHPDYMPLRTSLTRAKYEIRPGATPTASVRLESGLTVHGRVTDESGEPIQGALLRIDFLNDERTDKTNDDGHYEVIGCEPGLTQIVVSAEGQAIDARKINIAPDMKPVDFEMRPGGTVRVRVLDHQGNPVPKARILFQDWRGEYAYFAFDRVDQYADEEGVWEWNEAPHDEFTADICQNDGMDLSEQPLIAREEEYVFQLPPALIVSGEVVDAETKEPIKTFEVVRGLRSPDEFISWQWDDTITVTDGTYKTRFNRQQPGYFVRVQAEGYQAAVSREVQYDEGQVTINFALKKGINVATQILTPDGEPAGGAEIALGIADSQISVKNGHIRDISTYAARATADEQGHFQFPPQNSDYQLVITHPAGYAHIKGKPGEALKPIKLTAWARVKGTFQAGEELVPDARITIAAGNLHSYGEGVPHVYEAYDTTTEPDGTFTFNRVVPGPARIGRSIVWMVNTGATEVTSSKMIPIETKPGQTLEIQIGGDGRPVIGTLVPPEGFEQEIIWAFADIDLRITPPPPPDIPEEIRGVPEKVRAWFKEWKETPAGKKWTAIQTEHERQRKQKPYYNASVARDGSFRIDNVTAGDYLLNVRFRKKPKLYLRQPVTVPPITEETRGKPIELGTLTLE